MNTHNNARLTPKGREDMIRAVVDRGLTKSAAARQFNTTPRTVAKWVARYNAVINEFLRSPPVAAALAKQGLITAGGPPEVLGELIERDMAKWQRVIQQAGITAE